MFFYLLIASVYALYSWSGKIQKHIPSLLGLLSRVFRGKLALFISAYAYVTCFCCDLYCGYGSVPTTWILAIAGDGNMCICKLLVFTYFETFVWLDVHGLLGPEARGGEERPNSFLFGSIAR